MTGLRRLPQALVLASALLAGPSRADGVVTDPRFFGEYCGRHVERIPVRILFFRVGTVSKTVSIKARAHHREHEDGQGYVLGDGVLTWDDQTEHFAYEGRVTERGRLEGSGVSGRFGSGSAIATLDEAGDELTLTALDRTVRLRKTACPNSPPRVEIRSPASTDGSPLRVHFGDLVHFESGTTDAEDPTIDWTRLVWTSDRDGRLGRGSSLDRGLWTFGRHRITLTATDRGGLTSSASVDVELVNQPPAVTIKHPLGGEFFYVGQPILFRGIARDPEYGILRGDRLWWFSSQHGPIGTGDAFTNRLAAGRHQITLLARDGAGQDGAASVDITVRHHAPSKPGRPGVNRAPAVLILSPQNLTDLSPGRSCVVLAASARDAEDGPLAASAIEWSDETAGTTRVVGHGKLSLCNLSNGVHRLIARVTDSGGRTGTDSVSVRVGGS